MSECDQNESVFVLFLFSFLFIFCFCFELISRTGEAASQTCLLKAT